MSRDTSPQERIALAEELGRFARTQPLELAELMYTNDLAVEILHVGLDLFIQQEQQSEVHSQMPDELMQKIIIVLDSNDGHVTKVFTSNPNLVVRVVDIDTEAQEPVWGPYDPGITVIVADVDIATVEHIKESIPEYQPEEEQEFAVRWIHTGKYEATYFAPARNQEEAHAYVAAHRQELEPVDVVPLSDDYQQFL
jgi:hypothetical protein